MSQHQHGWKKHNILNETLQGRQITERNCLLNNLGARMKSIHSNITKRKHELNAWSWTINTRKASIAIKTFNRNICTDYLWLFASFDKNKRLFTSRNSIHIFTLTNIDLFLKLNQSGETFLFTLPYTRETQRLYKVRHIKCLKFCGHLNEHQKFVCFFM